jgi:hypothetical protein
MLVYEVPSGKIEKETQGREQKPVLLSCVLHTVCILCLGMGWGVGAKKSGKAEWGLTT